MKYLESFFWGIIAALGAVVLEFLLTESLRIPYAVFTFAVMAAGVEEMFKYAVISRRIKKLFEKKSPAAASFLAGLGFAAVEVFLIYEKIGTEWRSHCFNIAGIILLHILTAVIIGYRVSAGSAKIWKKAVKAWGTAFIVHLIFNLAVI